MRPARVVSSLLVLASVASPLAARAEDWPRWMGPRGDGIAREDALVESWGESGPTVAWRMPAGKGYAGLVVSAGRAFAFFLDDEKDVLVAHDAATGKVLWRSEGTSGFEGQYEGTRATPWVEGDRIFTYGGDGELMARDVATGKLHWKVAVLAEAGSEENLRWGTASSPYYEGGRVFVQAGQGGHVALAVDAATGKVAWKSEAKGIASYAPVVPVETSMGRQFVVFAGDRILGLDRATGRTLWSQEWKTSYDVNAATPISVGNRLFVSSGYGHGSAMFELGASKLAPVWETKALGAKFPAPILDGETIYGNSEGRLVALHWKSGRQLWEGAGKELRLGHGGTLLRWKDRLFVLTERGALSLVKADASGVTVLAHHKEAVGGEDVWSMPALANGLLYVKGSAEIVVYDMRAKPAP